MKRSAIPTDFILLEAYTNSEWDNCQFAIVQLTDEYKRILQNRLTYLTPLLHDTSLSGISFWDASAGFYKDAAEDTQPLGLLRAEETQTYLTLDPGELERLPAPESRLDNFQLTITPDGTASFTASGKHTGETFWTASFDLKTMLSA